MTLVPRVVDLLKEKQAEDVVVIAGRHDPGRRHPRAEALGVPEIFTPGASTQDIVEFVRGAVSQSADDPQSRLTMSVGTRDLHS